MNIPGLLLLTAAALTAWPACARDQVSNLPVLAQESLPPKWINRGDHSEGVCPDILQAIEKAEPRLHFTGQHEFRSIPVIEQGLESGNVACACALLDTQRRRDIATIVGKPLYMVRHRVAAAANDRVKVDSLEELVKLKPLVNTSRGAGYSDQLRALGLKVDDSTSDNVINLKKIIAGHGRFFYMNELSLNWIVRENGLGDQVRLVPGVLKEEPIYFWVSKKVPPATVHLLDQTLLKLRATGELNRIYERWSSGR
ncbi:transporter substrate-binding domain-containing protein [Duganella sp. LX20W]|uniref:Transporter substrate-binding domain-containing protein n=1 Tax=Rugamonas brunnea TaxID=2758569 RepID=A0A7W2ICS9_9BURK|nr:transporter substrate-binding domain-containing protein [Rugamonas brunnea]MBA5638669.1 transporter substrate-binding domain-containing protein [Rugamonas brunnea]